MRSFPQWKLTPACQQSLGVGAAPYLDACVCSSVMSCYSNHYFHNIQSCNSTQENLNNEPASHSETSCYSQNLIKYLSTTAATTTDNCSNNNSTNNTHKRTLLELSSWAEEQHTRNNSKQQQVEDLTTEDDEDKKNQEVEKSISLNTFKRRRIVCRKGFQQQEQNDDPFARPLDPEERKLILMQLGLRMPALEECHQLMDITNFISLPQQVAAKKLNMTHSTLRSALIPFHCCLSVLLQSEVEGILSRDEVAIPEAV